MAFVAARTNAGTRKKVNEDACCIEVAQTTLGEVLMAIVCDGVGGLSRGNVASSTVIDRFVRWFEGELPMLLEGMAEAGAFDFGLVKAVWGTILQAQNDLIRTYGIKAGGKLGTTFTGVIICGDHYLIGHVGDCRAYRMNALAFEQITEDQTLVAKRLAAGEITAEEAKHQPKNVILQSVGTERVVRPVFYEGPVRADDLFVICCDGAYHRAENEGIKHLFQHLDYHNEAAMDAACETLLRTDMDYGEKDNLTVVCFSGDLAAAGEEPVAAVAASHDEDEAPTIVESAANEDEAPTQVDTDEGVDEDDLATMVESESDEDEDDLVTMVADGGDDVDEDDAPTMVADYAEENAELAFALPSLDEDDAPTMVAEDDADEDDAPTMVADKEPAAPAGPSVDALAALFGGSSSFGLPSFDADEDDAPTMVAEEDDADEDDAPTMVADEEPAGPSVDALAALFGGSSSFGLPSFDDEDDAPTMVAGEDDVEDDAPTMVADEEPAGPSVDALAALFGGSSSFGLPSFDADEDDAPTMVADEDDDDLPTMVEGADA